MHARAVAVLVVLIAAFAVPSAASAAPAGARLLTTQQSSVLRTHTIPVRVGAHGALRITLDARLRFGSGRPAGLTHHATLHFGRHGTRTVKLRLPRIGLARAGRCNGTTLVLYAAVRVPRRGHRRAHTVRFTVSRRWVIDLHRCDPAKGLDLSAASRCDVIDPSRCMLPFPNDFFTRRDDSTPTGRRVSFTAASMPHNKSGVPINPADYNRTDGFSPGAPLLTHIAGFDNKAALDKTGAAPVTDIGRYADAGAPIVVIDTTTGKRWPVWSEVDANASSPQNAAVEIHPAVNFTEGHRYVVALRNLKTASGSPIPAGQGFRLFRDKLETIHPEIEGRRAHFESIFSTLAKAGVSRGSLNLAWDFTVASAHSLAGRMLAIRDQALTQLGTNAPAYTIDSSTDYSSGDTARKVTGTFTVPCYLDQTGCPTGSRFHYAPGASEPSQIPGNTYSANFICIIPRSVAEDPAGAGGRASLYGHGLLGSANEVTSSPVTALAQEHKIVLCATDTIGFAGGDVPTAIKILGDFSHFPESSDRVQQSWVNNIYLGRLLKNPAGFAGNAAFQVGTTAHYAVDPAHLYYYGISQGGVLGGALSAVSPDIERSVLGVPGEGYATLLPRSTDFATYKPVFYPAYPDELERPLVLSIVQMLWDSSENQGYAEHLTANPYAGTQAKRVLMQTAFGDFQVANVQAEALARTIGARVNPGQLKPGRSTDVTPFYGIATIPSFPYAGSAIIPWDGGPVGFTGTDGGGTAPPPTSNTAPAKTPPGPNGSDPHSYPRKTPAARQQISDFLTPAGVVTDRCAGDPCFSNGYSGTP